MEAFVYCWTDHKTNKLYVGSHKGTIDDGYVCSSKSMMEEFNQRPCDFTRQIIAFGKLEDIRVLECKILKSVSARLNEDFYNKHDNDGFYFEGWKKGQFSDEHKRNMSLAASNRKRTTEHLDKLHEGRRNSKNSQEHNEILRKYRLNNPMTKESIQKANINRQQNNDLSKLNTYAGKMCQKKRKDSGYYQTEEWKLSCLKGWETRRNNKIKKEVLVNGD